MTRGKAVDGNVRLTTTCPKCKCKVSHNHIVLNEVYKIKRCLNCLRNMTINDLKLYPLAVRTYLINQI